MTPKQKAKTLVGKFEELDNPNVRNKWYAHDYKNCAIICCDEILKQDIFIMDTGLYDTFINYWQEVKTEIQKL